MLKLIPARDDSPDRRRIAYGQRRNSVVTSVFYRYYDDTLEDKEKGGRFNPYSNTFSFPVDVHMDDIIIARDEIESLFDDMEMQTQDEFLDLAVSIVASRGGSTKFDTGKVPFANRSTL